jgi:cystathionine beta-lyase family protein involved in aluminum resistance
MFNLFDLPATRVGQDSAVSLATHYRLEGPGIESRGGARFSALVQTGPGVYLAPRLKKG